MGGNLTDFSLELLHYLTYLSLISLIFLAIIGKDVFALVFGSSWELAGTYAQILSFTFFMTFISRPFGAFFSIFEKQEVRLYFDTILVISSCASFLIGGLAGSILLSVSLYSLSRVIISLTLMFWLLNFIGAPYIKVFKVLTGSVIVALPFLAMLTFAKFVLHCTPVVLVIFSVILMFLYYIILIYRDKKIKNILGLTNLQNKIV